MINAPSNKMTLSALVVLVTCMTWIPCAFASAQPDGKKQSTFSDQVSVEWVSVSTVVESKKGRTRILEPGLFKILVDGREVAIEEFEPSGEIVHLLYLQDVSGSMDLRRRMTISRSAYRQMVNKLTPGDELTVLTFAAPRARIQQDSTSDLELLRGLEDTWRGWGETALIDSLAGIPQLSRTRWGRTSALLVTDGVDTASELPADQVRTLLSGAGIPVYIFGLEGSSGASRKTRPVRHEPSMEEFATEEDLQGLRALAVASGGRYIDLTNTSIEFAVSRVLRDIRNRVFLGFPTRTNTPRSMHTLEVVFLEKRSVVHHRTHYFGHQP